MSIYLHSAVPAWVCHALPGPWFSAVLLHYELFAPLQLEGGNNAQLALSVSAVGRVQDADSILGSVVKILTAAGTITLDDTSISFSVSISHHKSVLFNMLLAHNFVCTFLVLCMAISSYQTLSMPSTIETPAAAHMHLAVEFITCSHRVNYACRRIWRPSSERAGS